MTQRSLTPYESQLVELLHRLVQTMQADTDRVLALSALQSQVYADLDALMRRYIKERDELMGVYAGRQPSSDGATES